MLNYHHGQIELQSEANTRGVADMLAGWTGPVGEFCRTADMLVLALQDVGGELSYRVLSGAAPIATPIGPGQVLLPPAVVGDLCLDSAVPCGALAISLAQARRARLNGELEWTPQGYLLTASEAFTNCRKYIAPSHPVADGLHGGPVRREVLGLNDDRLAIAIAGCETSFLASVSPDGGLDVSHRGGPAGFLRFEPETARLAWDEYVGDGMFKSAGNIRATGKMALLVLDISSGDGYELRGRAEVTVQQRDKTPRLDALVQQREQFPVQGSITCAVEAAFRLEGVTHPRRRLEKRERVTSSSSLELQYPH